jgi:hypothetical protein
VGTSALPVPKSGVIRANPVASRNRAAQRFWRYSVGIPRLAVPGEKQRAPRRRGLSR